MLRIPKISTASTKWGATILLALIVGAGGGRLTADQSVSISGDYNQVSVARAPLFGCPSDWEPFPAVDQAANHVQSSCSKDGWTVYLRSDGTFWRAIPPADSDPALARTGADRDGWVIDPSAVPAWH